ncbi:hypothetical protein BN59_01921 [Legionella massiliensis]|uniref:Opacity protein antigens n=1 Tax=Legionella massiliensis TaxID=1034943 RepID=A0A078KX63_9GAMM|nr:hypothetical protein [Legionella massiliensis]CDZ77637.1 hypothetical protein BN59_01921 [Legionella massiliensis]CEE13375.1 hypothetical protein BN1094_01921 [Legionella massiliensis]
MKKTALTIGLIGLMSQNVFAGDMGVVNPVQISPFIPFISGEGAVTWNTIKSARVFDVSPSTNKDKWGGRVAVGFNHQYRNNFGFSSEIGWGYYGRTSSHVFGAAQSGSLAISNSSDLYGFDILAGLTYDLNRCSLFLKAGAMAENRRVKGLSVFRNSNNTTNYVSSNKLHTVSTNVLPEVKVGGIYNVNDIVGISLAYMHVFGNNNYSAKVSGAFSNPQATAGVSSTVSAQNPSLDSLMFGLVLRWV